jgi:CheY-like chemotaxis protein
MARILVVDDSPTIRKVVTGILGRHGYETIAAADGQLALDALQHGEAPIDLVLLDFVMPKMNGFQFCRAVRTSDRFAQMPVVLMSAKSDKIRDQFVEQTGALDAISKPFDAQALVVAIENALRRVNQGRASQGRLPDVDDLEQLPTSSGSIPVAGAGEKAMALSGDLGVVPIGAVLQMLQVESQTGVIVISNGKSEVTVSMRSGLIDLVQSRGAGDEFRLGRFFVEEGLVTPAEIDALLKDHGGRTRSGEIRALEAEGKLPTDGERPSTIPPPPIGSGERPRVSERPAPRPLLGDVLVQSGRVTQEQLKSALARQSSELVYEVLRWPRGRFELRVQPATALAQRAQLGLPVASVVMEGFRRVDEWRLVEAGLGNFESVLVRDPVAIEALPPGPESGGLSRPESVVLAAIDGERTVREIIAASHMSSFDACRILMQFLEARLVRRRHG